MMEPVPREYIDRYVDALNGISATNKKLLAKRLALIDFTDQTAAIDQTVALMQAVCAGSRNQAAVLASEFYKGVRALYLGDAAFNAVTDSGFDAAATEGAVRASAQKLVDGDQDAFALELASRVGYEVKAAAGNALMANGRKDGRKPRFARVPRGSRSYPGGCPFCRMLASRGFVYASEGTAGALAHYHDDCNCAIVPGWGDSPRVDGYDPHDYDGAVAEFTAADHSRHEKNMEGARRNRYTSDGLLRAGYSGKSIDQQEAMDDAARARQHAKNVANQHEGWMRAYKNRRGQGTAKS